MTKRREKKLLDRVRDAIRSKHYPIRTEEAYVNWIKRFILFHDKQHPQEMEAAEIEEFLAVYLPDALEQKYPNANCEWIWQYVFPSKSPSQDPRSGVTRCHHLTKVPCKERSGRRPNWPTSTSTSPPMSSATPSLPTCYKMATTYVLSKSC